MLISVVIPCYNCEDYIEETIESVLGQTNCEVQIVCVDNNSTDSSVDIIKEIAKVNPSVELYFEKQIGANYARNLGIKKSRGEYIQFLDSDDVITSSKLEEQVNFMISNNLDVVVSDRKVFDSKLEREIESYQFPEIEKTPLETAISKIIITGNPLYKRSVVIGVGAFLEGLKSAQDWEFNIRLFLENPRVGYLPGYYLKSRTLTDSLSSNYIEVSDNACYVIGKHKKKLVSNIVYKDMNVLRKILFTYLISYQNSYQNSDLYKSEFLFWYKLGSGKGVFSFKNRFFISLFGVNFFLFLKKTL